MMYELAPLEAINGHNSKLSANHGLEIAGFTSHGIKVMLEDTQVGQIQEII